MEKRAVYFPSGSIGGYHENIGPVVWRGIVYLDESVKSMLFAGKLDRSEEITPILDVLRTTDKLSVDVKGKKIVIGLK